MTTVDTMTCSAPTPNCSGTVRLYKQPFRREVYRLCDGCHETLTTGQFALRFHLLEDQPLPTPIPLWRKRLTARDETGRMSA